ncbi:diguanylate phosphodiesterase [Alsobacter metallidurans]|uniref:Diguanylate phosphodiesterase n=1 Tax=Alsobacter metallidurans TaxID=340221 RepID=A0A917I509_9HYPH|nr:EAL domain-containing response regulator [Alsobacter metallidurans]GGH15319.1 diguanylate phosphodiesterase [Alsobacter metallidurans]
MTHSSPSRPVGRGAALVIDDDAMQRMLISSVAKAAHYRTDAVGSVADALEALNEADYAVVIVDLSLGERDGVEAIRHIAGTGKRPALLVVSGLDARIRDSAIRLGQTLGLATLGNLEKPIDIARLRACLDAELPDPLEPGFSPREATIEPGHLAEAIRRGEIRPYYQPKIDLATGHISGVEALARWSGPIYGAVSPVVFIPLIERYGLAPALTRSILRQSVADAANWTRRFGRVGVAVNVPAAALTDLAFPDLVEETLATAGLSPTFLTLEVTESVALSDDRTVGDVLTRLRIKGIQLSLDDFGTGYASLSSLLRMPFGELKIDRSFVQAADSDSHAWKIVRATLSLAREFEMSTVAEGIETEAVATMLRQARCDTAQGFLFARPKPLDRLLERIALERPDGSAEPAPVDPYFRRH